MVKGQDLRSLAARLRRFRDRRKLSPQDKGALNEAIHELEAAAKDLDQVARQARGRYVIQLVSRIAWLLLLRDCDR